VRDERKRNRGKGEGATGLQVAGMYAFRGQLKKSEVCEMRWEECNAKATEAKSKRNMGVQPDR
jgi:hypothetical protein